MRGSDLAAELENARRGARMLGLVLLLLAIGGAVAGSLLVVGFATSSAAMTNTEANTAEPAR